jgi:hypothetical protein
MSPGTTSEVIYISQNSMHAVVVNRDIAWQECGGLPFPPIFCREGMHSSLFCWNPSSYLKTQCMQLWSTGIQWGRKVGQEGGDRHSPLFFSGRECIPLYFPEIYVKRRLTVSTTCILVGIYQTSSNTLKYPTTSRIRQKNLASLLNFRDFLCQRLVMVLRAYMPN